MFWSWTENTPQPGDVIQADDRGVPGWVPTTGEIATFRGAPKTPGVPHYLDGLPMGVVSQLGYVERGNGSRGIFSLVDDFIGGYKLVSLTGGGETNYGPYHFQAVAGDVSGQA